MTAISITPGYPNYSDTDGSALNDGYVYIGLEYQNPITAPTGAFWDQDFQIPADQPLRTSGGYIVRNGSPAAVYTGAAYSILVQNKNLVTVYNAPSAVITNVTNTVEDITQYQGAHATDPLARNDGTPLQVGDLYFNTSINELKVWTGSVWAATSPGNVAVQNFTGTGSQTAFTLSAAPIAENNTQIYIDGVYQQKDTYAVAGATINFSAAPPNLSTIEVVSFSIASLGTVDSSNVSYNQGGTGAVNQSVQSKLQESVSPQDFGAAADGSTNDTVAIQAALNSGSPIISGGGKTYKVNGSLTMVSDTVLEDCVFDYSGGADSVPCVTAAGTLAANISLTSNAAISATTLSVADSSSLSEHDWILVSSDAVFDDSDTDSQVGEFVQVASQSSGTITLRSPLVGAYATADAAKINKVSFVENITLRNVTIIGSSSDDNGQHGFKPYYASNVLIESCRFENLSHNHVQLVSCINSKCTSSYFENTVQDSTQAYGFSVASCCQDVVCDTGSFNYLRHSWSTNNLTGYAGIPRRCSFDGNTVTNSAKSVGGTGGDAIDTHSAAEDIFILNNTVYGASGSGINFECRSGAIQNNSVFDAIVNGIYYHNESDSSGKMIVSGNVVERPTEDGIKLFQGIRGTAAVITSLVVADNQVRDTGAHGIRLEEYQTSGEPRNVSLTGNVIYGTTSSGMYIRDAIGLNITGNSFRRSETKAIDIRDSAGVSITGNNIQHDSAAGSERAVNIQDVNGITFSGNSIYKESGTGPAVAVRGDSIKFVISNNSILSSATSSIVSILPTSAALDTGAVINGNTIGPVTTSSQLAISMDTKAEYVLVTSNNVRGTTGMSLGSGTGNVSANNIT